MRDLLVFGLVMLTLPLSFRRPFIGLLMFSWLAYMRPQDLCWGFARTMRLSFFVGMTMVVGWWANERGRRPFARWDGRCISFVVLTAVVLLSYGLAKYHTEYFNRYMVEFIKIMVVALFTTGQVDTRQRFRIMIWTISICLAFYGVKGGLFGVLTGGATILRGPGGMMEDNNDFALALAMNIPLLWYLGNSEEKIPLVKQGTRAAIFLTVVTILLTHSRGGFLSLVGAMVWIAWRSRKLFQACLALALCVVMFFSFAPQSVLDRLGTIGDTSESSINARLTAWAIAMRMVEDNPVFGVGLRNFQPRYLDYAMVAPDARVTTYVAHNSYFQIWAENGSLAFLIYMGLLASVFITCRRVYRMGRVRPDMPWAMDYARMMEATTVAFMIGAFFLNRGHFDLIYHWLALVTCLATVAYAAWRASPQQAIKQKAGVKMRRRPVIATSGGQVKPQPRWGRTT